LPDGIQNKGSFSRPHISLTDPQYKAHRDEINNATRYTLINAIGSNTLEDGKYLYNPATQRLEIQWVQGIGSEKAAAPQGKLMATVINGILSRRLPWGLVMIGVALVIMIELLGVRSLTLAVGAYLSMPPRWLSSSAESCAGSSIVLRRTRRPTARSHPHSASRSMASRP